MSGVLRSRRPHSDLHHGRLPSRSNPASLVGEGCLQREIGLDGEREDRSRLAWWEGNPQTTLTRSSPRGAYWIDRRYSPVGVSIQVTITAIRPPAPIAAVSTAAKFVGPTVKFRTAKN